MQSDEVIRRLKEELAQIRSDRATPALVENIPVEAYDTKLAVKELGSISTPSSQELLISPWDKQVLEPLEKALERFNPRNDGDQLRIVLPALTDERKLELEKEINGKAEQARIAVRVTRDKEREIIKQDKDEDVRFTKLKQLDESIEEVNQQIEQIRNRKITEVCS